MKNDAIIKIYDQIVVKVFVWFDCKNLRNQSCQGLKDFFLILTRFWDFDMVYKGKLYSSPSLYVEVL